MEKVKEYAKLIAALLTAALEAVVEFALPLPEEVQGWVQVIIAVLGAYGVYQVPNRPAYQPAANADAPVE